MKRTILIALPPATAIFVFGVIYGSLSRPQIGVGATIVSSALIFSGSVQFTVAALLKSGAGTAALLAGATTLNLRNLVLGAVLRPRIDRSAPTRAAMGWFLTDEAAGLALTSGEDASRTLIASGAMFYLSWQLGTVVGLLGASVESLASAAGSVFPVLLVGLAAAVCPSWSVALRAVLAAVVAGLAAWLWPGSQAIVAVAVAALVSLPADRA